MFSKNIDIQISSGVSGLSYVALDRIESVGYDYAIQRNDINQTTNSRPLINRSVINYTPINYEISFVKGNKDFESHLGLTHPSGIAFYIANSNNLSNYGCRNFHINVLDGFGSEYQSKVKLISGFLQSYSINGSIGDIVKGSIKGDSLSISIEPLSGPRAQKSYDADLINPNNVKISGIEISGFGISGFYIQSFNIDVNFSRQDNFKLGNIFPDKTINQVNGRVNFNGFIKNLYPISGLLGLNGNPETGNLFITLLPCSNNSTSYVIKNPYFESFSFGDSVGSFMSVQIGLSVPLAYTLDELRTGSNITII